MTLMLIMAHGDASLIVKFYFIKLSIALNITLSNFRLGKRFNTM
jgi:hypothetical protein